MREFQVKDKVVALSSKDCKYTGREEGKEYNVHGVTFCKKCNQQFISIHPEPLGKTFVIKCGECGDDTIKSNHPWTSAKHFVLATESTNKEVLLIKLENAIRAENYEEAAKLRDMLNSNHEH